MVCIHLSRYENIQLHLNTQRFWIKISSHENVWW